ncbi:trafficking protein particle complex subunit 5-like protein [Leptotrombidium deliense]|uniref:Trafficking protein particle complex subunit 5 n=1 Tax=Leptotrombidium deliense TaxID=299467 RepID=A0A443SKT0_9ACAR|nr:trafficking protein particle complex subunit 5-like protein [Leptotrombidium deliense]
MEPFTTFTGKTKVNPLDRPLVKPKYEINISLYALLFSEMVQYCHNKVYTVPELQNKLSEMGYHVGQRIIDALFIREKNFKREIRLINTLVLIKTSVWKALFGKEADKLEHANDDETTYYIIEKETIVNKFISVPRDKGNLNCASFIGGIIEAILTECSFVNKIPILINSHCLLILQPAKVTVHWHKGTTFMIKFDESVIIRDKALDNK